VLNNKQCFFFIVALQIKLVQNAVSCRPIFHATKKSL